MSVHKTPSVGWCLALTFFLLISTVFSQRQLYFPSVYRGKCCLNTLRPDSLTVLCLQCTMPCGKGYSEIPSKLMVLELAEIWLLRYMPWQAPTSCTCKLHRQWWQSCTTIPPKLECLCSPPRHCLDSFRVLSTEVCRTAARSAGMLPAVSDG